ncbi:hypothetical protein OAO87_00295 [bacterium]|nr:hypothetical protein [bacterium]
MARRLEDALQVLALGRRDQTSVEQHRPFGVGEPNHPKRVASSSAGLGLLLRAATASCISR